jgi:hypothetical protein
VFPVCNKLRMIFNNILIFSFVMPKTKYLKHIFNINIEWKFGLNKLSLSYIIFSPWLPKPSMCWSFTRSAFHPKSLFQHRVLLHSSKGFFFCRLAWQSSVPVFSSVSLSLRRLAVPSKTSRVHSLAMTDSSTITSLTLLREEMMIFSRL